MKEEAHHQISQSIVRIRQRRRVAFLFVSLPNIWHTANVDLPAWWRWRQGDKGARRMMDGPSSCRRLGKMSVKPSQPFTHLHGHLTNGSNSFQNLVKSSHSSRSKTRIRNHNCSSYISCPTCHHNFCKLWWKKRNQGKHLICLLFHSPVLYI